MSRTADRFQVSAVITSHGEPYRRAVLGSAPSRRKARRLGYREGAYEYPLRSTSTLFELEIIDTVTGETVPAGWAEEEAYQRARALPTVADVGFW